MGGQEQVMNEQPTSGATLPLEPPKYKVADTPDQERLLARQIINQDVWIMHGKRYDFSSFVSQHPGGEENILLGRGRDCTELFESMHALCDSRKPWNLLDKYEIKDQSDGQLVFPTLFDWENESGFYRTVTRRVKQYLKDNKTHHHANWLYHAKVIIMGAIFINSLVRALFLGSYLHALIAGFVSAQFYFVTMHDGNHSGVSFNAAVNRFYGNFCMLFFWDSFLWLRHHCYSHHCYTGIYLKDCDLANTVMFCRKHPQTKWRWYYKFQQYYIWFLLSFFPNQVLGQAIVYALGPAIANNVFGVRIEDRKPSPLKRNLFFSSSFAIYLVLPFLFTNLSASNILLVNLVMWTIMGTSYWVIVLPNHDTEQVHKTTMVPSAHKKMDWGELQLRNSGNHSVEPTLLNRMIAAFYGGMNFQIEHHLFPCMSHIHLPGIAPIVQQTAKEFNIPYNAEKSWFHAVCSYFRLLGNMSKKQHNE